MRVPRSPALVALALGAISLAAPAASAQDACPDVPEGWECFDFMAYDGLCECGCGALDPDCPDDTLESCEIDVCDVFDAALAPDNPTRCVPLDEQSEPNPEPEPEPDGGVPAPPPADAGEPPSEGAPPAPTPESAVPDGWGCDPARYGDGACDCGCGDADLDCPSDGVEACEVDHCAPSGRDLVAEDPSYCRAPQGASALSAPAAIDDDADGPLGRLDADRGCAAATGRAGPLHALAGALALLLARRRRPRR